VRLLLLVLLLGLPLCPETLLADLPPGEDAQAYRAEIEAWRARRDASLRGETGWLTIAGLFWLQPGDNLVGTGPEASVPLPPGSAPDRVAILRLEDDPAGGPTVRLVPEPKVDLQVGGKPAQEQVLATDEGVGADADVVSVGRLSFWIIERGGELAVRLRDPECALRTGFHGVDDYPIDPAYRVVGRLEGVGTQELTVTNVLGQESTALTPGQVAFTLQGELCRLLPMVDDAADSNLFFVFADATTGKETYEAGRFLSARLEPGGTVVLDFNRAYNPPCAFNPYTTCPLPPEGNTLPLPVRAGEKDYHE